MAGWPAAQVASPVVIAAAGAVLAAVMALSRLPRRRRATAAAALLSLGLTLALAACAFRPVPMWETPSGLRVTFLDVGQGDAVLLEVPGARCCSTRGRRKPTSPHSFVAPACAPSPRSSSRIRNETTSVALPK